MTKYYAFITLLFLSFTSISQNNSKGLNYQAVILDPHPMDVPGVAVTGQPLSKGKVWVRFTLKNQSTIDYEEIQQTTTDEFGLINLQIGNGIVSTSISKYPHFDSIIWDSNTKSLQVGVNFDGGKNFTEVSNQALNYTPYALYAESVDYKNVRSTPKNLSDFTNDSGFLIAKDLEPLQKEIATNKSTISSLSSTFDVFEQKNKTDFLIINQKINSIQLKLNTDSTLIQNLQSSVAGLSSTLNEQSNRINSTENNVERVRQLSESTQQTISNLGGTFENKGNKSTDIIADASSNSKYPTVKSIKDYVDAIFSVNSPDVTNKEPTILAGTSSQYYRGDKSWQTLDKAAVDLANVNNTSDANKPVSTATQTALDLKANTSDVNTSLAAKESLSNKSTDISADASSTTKYPSVKTIKDYVDATVSSGVSDASTSLKGKIKLAGDLGGTADSPTVPGLLNKEPSILAGTSSQYYRGDKSWQTLDKAAVDLANVNNTSDANKPVSTATQTALDLKANSSDVNSLKDYVDENFVDFTTDYQSITGYKIFENNIGLVNKSNGVPAIIEFNNGSKIGDIDGIEINDPDENGAIDLYAPLGARWVELNYGNKNYVELRDDRFNINMNNYNWRFDDTNGLAKFPGDLIVGADPDNPTRIVSTNTSFSIQFADDYQNPSYINGMTFTDEGASLSIGDPNNSPHNWYFHDNGSTIFPNSIKIGTTWFPSVSGNTGDVLTINNNGDAEWQTFSSGGGNSTGISSINNLINTSQNFSIGNNGTDFNINSDTNTGIHTFNLPDASTINRGLLTSTDFARFDNKQDALNSANTSRDGYLLSSDFTIFNNKQDALTNPITGNGSNTAGELAFFTGNNSISSESNLFWDSTHKRLGIGLNYQRYPLEIFQDTEDEFGLSILSPPRGSSTHAYGTSIGFSSNFNPISPGGANKGSFQLDGDGNMVFRTMQSDMYFDNFNDPGFSDPSQTTLNPNFASINFRIGRETGSKKGMNLNSDGNLHVDGTVESGSTLLTSDIRLKKNIKTFSNALSIIKQFQPVEYDKKMTLQETNYVMHEHGFIAQELQKILPSLVKESSDADKLLSVNYNSLIPILTKGIQEQQKIIESQQARLEALEEMVKSLGKEKK